MYSRGRGGNGGVLQTPKEGTGTGASPRVESNILAGEGEKPKKSVTVLKFPRRNNNKMQAFKTPEDNALQDALSKPKR